MSFNLEEQHTMRLTLEGADRVFDALENPPKPNKDLLAAAKRFKDNGGFYNDLSGNKTR